VDRATAATYSARVRKGAELLDEHRPGWQDTVSTSILDVKDPACCVVTQSFDPGVGFARGTDELGLWSHDCIVEHGFDLHAVDPISYDELAELWQRAIHRRRR
jgi:hypothetical protein